MSIISPLRDKQKGFDGCPKDGHAPLAGCAFHSCRGYLHTDYKWQQSSWNTWQGPGLP